MINLSGKYSDAVVFTDNIESEATAQIFDILNTKVVEGELVRIMPDVHLGKGCVVGYTQTYSGQCIDPDLIGCDIGCSVSCVTYKHTKDLDLSILDYRIRKVIPMGQELNKKSIVSEKEFFKFLKQRLSRAESLWPDLVSYTDLDDMDKFITKFCRRIGMDLSVFWRSLGTLGGGNHFIELGRRESGDITLTIHCGSRNLGVRVLSYWKNRASNHSTILKKQLKDGISEIRELYKDDRQRIGIEIEKLKSSKKFDNPGNRFLECKEDISGYLCDVFFAQAYAEYNHLLISDRISKECGFHKEIDRILTTHNYIDPRDKVIRKGSVSSHEGDLLVIPMNMSYGILICRGLGNPDWNYSSPHGAGRLMSRNKSREKISLEEFRNSMSGVFSTSICESCIDESPSAYKDPTEITSLIDGVCVKILETVKPLLSIKAISEKESC